ncbi:testisin-like isoform X1 [Daphnia pulicaria]|nr:testisin-like isoform X1 [Daphnia pulicaria]
MSPTGRKNHPWLSLATCYLLMASTAIFVAAQHEPDRPLDQEQVISDLRQLLDLQFDLTNNGSAEISPVNLMKRMSNLRQLRDPHTMNRLAQMARQRPPPPPPFAIQQPGRFNNFRYPPTPSTFMGAPPPPPNFQPAKQQPDHHPNLYLGVDGHLQSPRNNELSESNRRIFFGDSKICYTDSCEFFLLCWLTGGLIQKSCGGFLFACCHRPGISPEPPTPYVDSLEHPVVSYGPVRSDAQCGTTLQRTDTAQRRIVGGDEAGFGTFPWQAYIRIGSSRCGGSLLNNYYVVTAGHCVARAKAEQVKITLGEYSLNSDVEPLSPVQVGVAEIHVHPYFKFTPQADRYDVAVLRLDRYVPYEPHISPICLPEKGDDFLGEYAWAAGWGAMQAGSRVRPKTLQVVDVPIIDNRQCEDWHSSKGINVIIYDEMMCAGYRNGGKDSCQGDSGGPLMLQQSGRWELVGIVSAGYSCAQNGQPGIYHRVSYTTDWISHIAFS